MKILELNRTIHSDKLIKSAFSSFLKESQEYRNGYLQSELKTGFDGYSYFGQTDSLNQYDTDMLHSFVLSDLQAIENFPKAFHEFLNGQWNLIREEVRSAELQIIKEYKLPFLELYEADQMSYMMSCNYYPKAIGFQETAKRRTRLSSHTDVSLLTTFPFGISEGLTYWNSGSKVEVGDQENMMMFPGYFAEFISKREVSALQHQVELPADLESERFSFALFSIPKPDAVFKVNGISYTGTEYYQKYLSLF